MKFKSIKSKINIKPYLDILRTYTNEKKFLDFFEKNNIATPATPSCIEVAGSDMSIDFFLGRSENPEMDYIKINEAYEYRIPDNFSAICIVNEIDFICIGPDSRFYLWSRYKNDLYFDPKHPNEYKPQDKNLAEIAGSFADLLNLINEKPKDKDINNEDDPYENPSIPFEDEDIADDFKNPDLFFKQSPHAIEIQIKKLQLSENGRKLLDLFKKNGLLPEKKPPDCC